MTGPPTATRQRIPTLDVLRGTAIALMLLDHALHVVAPGHILRYTLTRASLPLFFIVAGYLAHQRPTPRRWLQLAAAGLLATGLLGALGGGVPDVVLIYALLVVPLLPVINRAPVAAIATAVVILATFPTVGVTWTGYHPAELVALVGCGVLLRGRLLRSLEHPALEAIGRRPLTWYVGHLLVLVLVTAVLP